MGVDVVSQASSGRPPFRADHVGSLLRPHALKQAFRERAAGRLDEAAFSVIQEEAVRNVVALQERAGLHVVTDGEFRRGSYWGRFVERLDRDGRGLRLGRDWRGQRHRQ